MATITNLNHITYLPSVYKLIPVKHWLHPVLTTKTLLLFLLHHGSLNVFSLIKMKLNITKQVRRDVHWENRGMLIILCCSSQKKCRRNVIMELQTMLLRKCNEEEETQWHELPTFTVPQFSLQVRSECPTRAWFANTGKLLIERQNTCNNSYNTALNRYWQNQVNSTNKQSRYKIPSKINTRNGDHMSFN